MGYRIRVGSTSSTWSPSILLLVAALIAGLLGMHVLDGHGSPTAGADPSSHDAMSAVSMSAAPMPATVGKPLSVPAMVGKPLSAPATAIGATALSITASHAVPVGHGCADCAEHAAMSESCVLAPVAPAALPGPPAEDLRPAIVASLVASPANDPADPRPPSISALCISRR